MVEGPTDRELIPRLAAKLGVTLFDSSSRISLLPAPGVDKLSDGSGIRFLEQLLGKLVKRLLLRDRDGLTEDWRRAIEAKSKREMFVWSRDCIESYLIVASAIHEVMREGLGDDKVPH